MLQTDTFVRLGSGGQLSYLPLMILLRAMLISILALSTSLSGVMAEEIEISVEHTHAVADSGASDEAVCCEGGAETAEACHHAPELVPSLRRAGFAQIAKGTRFVTSGLVLTGIELPVPLDPPRSA